MSRPKHSPEYRRSQRARMDMADILEEAADELFSRLHWQQQPEQAGGRNSLYWCEQFVHLRNLAAQLEEIQQNESE